jgi:hypothetical protein
MVEFKLVEGDSKHLRVSSMDGYCDILFHPEGFNTCILCDLFIEDDPIWHKCPFCATTIEDIISIIEILKNYAENKRSSCGKNPM